MQSLAVRALAALWLALFIASFVVLFTAEPTGAGDSFMRGLDRLASFLTWQGVAFAPAVVAAFLTYSAGGVGGNKLLGYGPLAVSVMVIGLLIAMIAFRVLVQPALL